MNHLKLRPKILGLGGTLRKASASSRATERSLHAAMEAGADVEMLDLEVLDLPMYRPGLPLEAFGLGARRLIEAVRGADGIVLGTSAYHGSVAGVTKNALDFLEFLASDENPYLQGKCIGMIATAAGDIAAVNAINAMIHVAHALRASVIPLVVPIPQAGRAFGEGSEILDQRLAHRLDELGRSVVRAVETSFHANGTYHSDRIAAPVVLRY